ncbi:hypothetical protein [Alloalcanivorax xenomutans]|uniref:hypothetical protein n=1 Tax=Alloalcanivorax xenomutans TaxID=1094342 RepID=UPI003BAB2F4B
MPRSPITLSINATARRLGIGPRQLRAELVAMGGIQRTEHGYEATREWLSKGLAVTHTQERWHPQFQRYRHTAHVMITGTGLDHLKLFIPAPVKKAHA